ncbi:MAG: outer membrane lipid asymmetry maintenance protein MlaD [Salibaculum sp.]|jgi:phospholipid/cholesterol/gamma-HCH transport system substrate-binding protein|uniref:outer membrane lipid asymmetry maintenance protein MlaD n=1 Tax=Roseovarius halophilus (ex Wu et al. 2025) TaxID=3376060 RepID=UPI00286FCD05|nr:outer membrane lipid asymmetry maintenance protein MlaD [Salibaculum sp.]MDR9428739.1 outer membrane lipid asymmetry maintenance protein MlaD [Salibaculum sp.]MDR9483220.1 outer membrane lipid asymmetry maintenance protein MlaD [Salibaculum sp.]
MRESVTEVIVGALVLAVAGGFLWYFTQATGTGGRPDSYDLAANFRSAEGVSVGTDIRMAGVSVGAVTALSLNPETYRAEAALSIDESIAIPEDSAAVVATEGLLGGTFVEIVPGGSFTYLEEGQVFQSTQGAVSVIQLLTKFVSGGDSE